MTYLVNPRHYTRDEFRTLVDGLTWGKGWRPDFPTLHNTGVPSLTQWIGYGTTAKERWGASLNRYYQGLGWHSGPHLVCCPDYIWNLCDLEQDGVSVSCWNRLTVGIEMVGDFRASGDSPFSGEGAKVIDNAVWALAILANKLEWSIGNVQTGVRGLHFHRECTNDHHACPGDLVNKSEIIGRVVCAMKTLGAARAPTPVPSSPVASLLPPSPPTDPVALRKWVQREVGVNDDGDIGDESIAAIAAFIAKHTAIAKAA